MADFPEFHFHIFSLKDKMANLNQIIIIVCEGVSEKAYIQELNRIFKEKEYNFKLVSKISEGGQYQTVINKFKSVRTINPKDKIYIWVDYDLYKRNDQGCFDKYRDKPKDIPDFLFSKMNFEDVLILHSEKIILDNWLKQCYKRNHFERPLQSAEFEPLFNRFCEKYFNISYRKGEIPFEMDEEKLLTIFNNIKTKAVPIDSDFHKMLLEYLPLDF